MLEIGSDASYRLLCEQVDVAILVIDREMNIRVWNRAASHTLGIDGQKVMGTPITHILPPERRARAKRLIQRAIDTGETVQLEFDHPDQGGERPKLVGTVSAIVTESGRRIGASIWVRDISRRVALQVELHEHQKMASLGEMAGAIAHHFNNILGGAVTSIDFANANEDPAVKQRVLEHIGPALQRATTLVNGLLAFAEGDRRSDDLSDFTELVNDRSDEIEGIIDGTDILFELNLPDLPVLPFPRGPVSTILRNITKNSIEAMPDGGLLRIDVTDDEDAISIRISDTGVGLDAAARLRIFEPFWSTKGVLTAGSGEAIGLGLATAHGFVHMLGGSISVTSDPGKGSCFRVTLPKPRGTP